MGLLKTAAHAAVAGYAATKASARATQTAPVNVQMNVPVLFLPDSRLYAHHFTGQGQFVGFDLRNENDHVYRAEAAKAGYVVREIVPTPNAKGWLRYIFEMNPAAAWNHLNAR